ncbi:MAG TPA: site-2 protease family protein, partial [Actinomycetota bacterium]|nr:site-2 protease family protein [Actinomycetota bacterium]
MFSRARTFLRIGDIPVRADASWLVVLALLTWSFWTRFNLTYPAGTALVIAAIATAAFSLSVIAHEIAHALEARHRGVPVGGITMYLFGGATEVYSDEVRKPGDEFALTVVGPWTSIVAASAFGLIAYVSGRLGIQWVADLCGELGWLNLLLGIFNLLPGAPLDGGRILAAIVWRITGDRWRAVRLAARAGRALGALVLAVGVLELFLGGFAGGLWLALIGWFLVQAALAEEHQANLREGLSGVAAGELVAVPPMVDPDTLLSAVTSDQFYRDHRLESLLVGDGESPSGVLTMEDIRRLPAGERARTAA